jgi:phosphoribosylformylglycinamidine (FGAM) synthase-like amidotransferase family enzyme
MFAELASIIPGGQPAITKANSHFKAMMPHPERVFRNVQMSRSVLTSAVGVFR